MNKRSKKPLVVAIGLLAVLVAVVIIGALSMTVECPYCHGSNDNVKGNCVLRQETGHCREDYYPEHHNKATCGWCKSTGKTTVFEAWAD
ncbi:MAG: hypothetical protein ACOX9C_11345 [Kiritimatiellia bacterium]|jgi:hypothetical protein